MTMLPSELLTRADSSPASSPSCGTNRQRDRRRTNVAPGSRCSGPLVVIPQKLTTQAGMNMSRQVASRRLAAT